MEQQLGHAIERPGLDLTRLPAICICHMERETVMKEVLVGITEEQERALNRLAKDNRSSRAAIIRQAIDDLLSARQREAGREAFGLWGKAGQDGLAYQRELRAEW